MYHGIRDIFVNNRLLPVAEIQNPEQGPHLAASLIKGGINILEVLLRTDEAISAVEHIIANEDILVGLGTVLEADQFRYAHQIGARFCTSPGLNVDLLNVANVEKMPYLPGAFTASEIMLARDLECRVLKFFPAYTHTGISHYPQLAGAFHGIRFCLTGLIDEKNFIEALKMPKVIAVGGSWLCPTELINAGKWDEITQRAKFAVEEVTKLNLDEDEHKN